MGIIENNENPKSYPGLGVKPSRKQRIAVMIFLLEAMVMGLVVWQVLEHAFAVSSEQVVATEQAVLDMVGDSSRDALRTGESADLQTYLDDLKKHTGIVRVMIADVRGRVVAASRPEDLGSGMPVLTDGGDYFWRTREIANAAGRLGVVAIEFSSAAQRRAYAGTRNLAIGIAVIGMAAIALGGMLTGFLPTRRRQRIAVAAQRATQGEPAPETVEPAHVGARGSVAEHQRHMPEDEHYRMLFERSPIGLVLCRMDGELVDINPAYAGIIGRSVQATLKLTYWDITPEKYAADEQRQLEMLNKTGRYGPYEKEFIHKDGHLVPVRLQGSLLEKAGQTFIWSSVEDITASRQAEEALRCLQKMEVVGRLSGGIAHDFNNKLGVIIGYLDFLKNHFPKDNKPRRWVDTATGAALRCMDLTRKLVTFSRGRSNEARVVDLNALLQDMDQAIARSVTTQVEVRCFPAPDLKPTEINPGEFQDAMLSLVINACDAMPRGGKLTIETNNTCLDADYTALNPGVEPGAYVQLTLSDTGTGMNKEILEHAFEPFFTTKSAAIATGLGLATVYGFVKRYGGHIEMDSEPGMGTAVRIYLPCFTAAESAAIVNDSRADVLPTGSESILIVDDEDGLLQLADQCLSGLGYRTHLALNAAEALEILAAEDDIDLLFSDVAMPGGTNGYELAQRAAEQRPDLKILLTSGYSAKTISNDGLARFAAHLLSKPYRKRELAQRVRLVLDEVEEKNGLSGRTILVIDDEEGVRELFKIYLERLGCSAVAAGNDDEALAIYRQSLDSGKLIDTVILDLTIPGSTGGKALADKIRALDPAAKIIVTSGHAEGPEMTDYRNYGFQAALEKKFNQEKIRQVLEQVLMRG